VVARNLIENNTAEMGAGIRFCYFVGSLPEPLITDNIVRANHGLFGGGIVALDADPVIQHCTLDSNEASIFGGGAYASDGGVIHFLDSIISNSPAGGGLYADASGAIDSDFCTLWNNTGGNYIGCVPGPNDLQGDPQFCDLSAADLRLFETSCCQGSGSGGTDRGAECVGCFTIPGVFFWDNFSDQDDDGWVKESSGQASIQVVSGFYQASAEPGGWVRAVVGPLGVPWEDYQLRLRTRPDWEASVPGGWIHLTLRDTGLGESYLVRLDSGVGELWKNSPQGAALLLEFPCTLPLGEWSTLSFLALGPTLQGWLEPTTGAPELLFFYEDGADPILTGTAGVGAEAVAEQVVAGFDDILAALLDPAAVDGASSAKDLPVALRVRPNPAPNAARLQFLLPFAGRVRVSIYDVRGARVRTLVDQVFAAGIHRVDWNGTDHAGRPMPAGVYLGALQYGGRRSGAKLLLVR